jgi:hypothetical protein
VTICVFVARVTAHLLAQSRIVHLVREAV